MPFYYYYIMLSIISLLFTWYVWSDLDYTMFAIAGSLGQVRGEQPDVVA